MSSLTKLELIPLAPESKSHHLLQVSGLCLAPQCMQASELSKIFAHLKEPAAVTSDVFNIWEANNPMWDLLSNKSKIHIIFDIAELSHSLNSAERLLTTGYNIDILFHKAPEISEIENIKKLNVFPNFKTIYIENLFHRYSVLKNLDLEILKNTLVTYLPKANSLDALLPPENVLENISDMKEQFGKSLPIIIIYNKNAPTSDDQKFYIEPTKEMFLKIKKENPKFLYKLFSTLRKIGIAQLLIFFLFTFRVISHPKIYFQKLLSVMLHTLYFLKHTAISLFFRFRILLINLKFIFLFLLYPFKKIYWFSDYQYRKRILKKDAKDHP